MALKTKKTAQEYCVLLWGSKAPLTLENIRALAERGHKGHWRIPDVAVRGCIAAEHATALLHLCGRLHEVQKTDLPRLMLYTGTDTDLCYFKLRADGLKMFAFECERPRELVEWLDHLIYFRAGCYVMTTARSNMLLPTEAPTAAEKLGIVVEPRNGLLAVGQYIADPETGITCAELEAQHHAALTSAVSDTMASYARRCEDEIRQLVTVRLGQLGVR